MSVPANNFATSTLMTGSNNTASTNSNDGSSTELHSGKIS